ncbi:MAG: hypothetical protein JO336_00235, partial [Acidobacteriia bacterium]|nr:hypothetical protein [Terriglobia bacterium]
MSLQFSVRYLLRTGLIARLAEFVVPVVLLGWDDPELKAELEAAGAEVHPLRPVQRGVRYERARSYMNLRYSSLLKSPSQPIWERRADLHRSFSTRIRRRLRKGLVEVGMAVPGASRWLCETESRLFWEDTNAREIAAWTDSLRPDAVFSLTPFLQNEETVVRVASLRGVPMIASILSFDNITARGWIAATFNRYLVWNRHNAAELRRAYPHVPQSDIEIVGSPQFDFYYSQDYLWEQAEWRRRLSLPQDAPVILFGGGHYFCAPHEPNFLLQLDDAIENNEISKRAVILFRCHPVDPIGRWLPILKKTRHVVRDDPWKLTGASGQVNVRGSDIQKLASTLYYSRVHVN